MTIESPCIHLCRLDAASGICTGCGRNGEEIAAWIGLSPEHRREIIDALPARLARRAAARLPATGGRP